MVAGIGAGDEVVVPSFSFVATTNAPRYVGATPVFADVDPLTGNVTAETVAAVLSERTKAIIVVHQGGVPADVEPLRELAVERGLLVIEDAACAAGSQYRGKPVGRGALMSAWSFHPRKLLTTGEGGMLTTDDADLAARLRRLREHGMSVSAADRHAAADRVIVEQYLEVGFNYRMTDVQAAIGLVQLGRLDAIVERRRALAERYQSLLGPVSGLRCVTDPSYGTSNFQSFWVELDAAFPVTRDELLAQLAAAGISARRGIMAAHLEPAHADLAPASLPITERLTSQTHPPVVPRSYRREPGPSGRGSRPSRRRPKVTAAQPLLLVGSGGLAREVAQALRGWPAAPWEPLGFLDDDSARWGTTAAGLPVLGPLEIVHEQPTAAVLVCTGRPGDYASRARLVSRLGVDPERFATVVHPAAWVSPDTSVGAGSVLLAGVVATASVRIGQHVAVMPGCVLTHDDVVDDFATLASHVVLGGSVQVERGAYLGAGSLVREGLRVGSWSSRVWARSSSPTSQPQSCGSDRRPPTAAPHLTLSSLMLGRNNPSTPKPGAPNDHRPSRRPWLAAAGGGRRGSRRVRPGPGGD